MYSRKSVGPRMEPWGTAVLTGYSCENVSFRTTGSSLLLKKNKIKSNIWPKIPWVLAPDLVLKALVILSDTTVRRYYAVDWKHGKPYWESEKKHISIVLSINPSANLFVFGDFNVHHKDWLTYSDWETLWTVIICYNFPTWIPERSKEEVSGNSIYSYIFIVVRYSK